MGEKEDVLNGLGNGERPANCENAGHGKTRNDPIVGEPHEGVDVVGEENTIFIGRPGQDFQVIASSETSILDTEDVQLGVAAPEATKDLVVEVLVCGEPEHVVRLPSG